MATFKSAAEADWHADSDDEDVEKTWHDVQSPVPGREEQGAESEEESDEDSSDEENEPQQSQGDKDDPAPKAVVKPLAVASMSKKEREALKKKELDDLDSLLAEVGVDVKPTATAAAEGEKKKKAKKPKAAAAPVEEAPAPTAVEVVKGDAAKALLAAKLQAKTSTGGGKTQSAAEKAALAEKEKEKASKLAKKKAKAAVLAGFDR